MIHITAKNHKAQYISILTWSYLDLDLLSIILPYVSLYLSLLFSFFFGGGEFNSSYKTMKATENFVPIMDPPYLKSFKDN